MMRAVTWWKRYRETVCEGMLIFFSPEMAGAFTVLALFVGVFIATLMLWGSWR